MPRVKLIIDDPNLRLTVKTLLETEGHQIVDTSPHAVVAASVPEALLWASRYPTLVLAEFAKLPEAIRAMKSGVYGYITLPLQPAEASLMVDRALAGAASRTSQTAVNAADKVVPLKVIEARYIRHALRQCKHNRAKAAKLLGIGRNTLWRKLKEMDDSGGTSE